MNTLRLSMLGPLLRMLPETRFFGVKRWAYRICGADIAEGVRICSSAVLMGSGHVKIGSNTWIGHQVLIISGSEIEVGADVDIAPRVFIGTGTHRRGTLKKAAGEGVQLPVRIGDGCWIGANATVLPGITLAKGTTVAAGAVVTNDVNKPGMTVGGIPARPLSTKVNE